MFSIVFIILVILSKNCLNIRVNDSKYDLEDLKRSSVNIEPIDNHKNLNKFAQKIGTAHRIASFRESNPLYNDKRWIYSSDLSNHKSFF